MCDRSALVISAVTYDTQDVLSSELIQTTCLLVNRPVEPGTLDLLQPRLNQKIAEKLGNSWYAEKCRFSLVTLGHIFQVFSLRIKFR
ncbi:hypothetical protein TNCV_3424381 [Trichonephila clavipes]|nr:hypothetical protein TNCV_3424381 [Trichonephila clavipes]